MLPKISNLKAGGVEISFIKDSIDAAVELAEKSPQWKVEIPSIDKKRVITRTEKHLDLFKDVQILWIDDHPENNINESKMFHELKAQITHVVNTEEALNALRRKKYDLVISDMTRGSDNAAGLDLLNKFRRENKFTPIIFYVGVFDSEKGVPPQSFGITNRPDELLHLVLDALERKIAIR